MNKTTPVTVSDKDIVRWISGGLSIDAAAKKLKSIEKLETMPEARRRVEILAAKNIWDTCLD